jgi:hypothetical protein
MLLSEPAQTWMIVPRIEKALQKIYPSECADRGLNLHLTIWRHAASCQGETTITLIFP